MMIKVHSSFDQFLLRFLLHCPNIHCWYTPSPWMWQFIFGVHVHSVSLIKNIYSPPMKWNFTMLSKLKVFKYSETCLNPTLSKPKTCLNQADFTVPSTKCLCNLNLCKPSTCLNWTNSSVPKGFGLDRSYCILFTPLCFT